MTAPVDGGFRAFLQDLNDSLGIRRKLSEPGITEAAIPDFVHGTIIDVSCGGNAINLTNLFKAAL